MVKVIDIAFAVCAHIAIISFLGVVGVIGYRAWRVIIADGELIPYLVGALVTSGVLCLLMYLGSQLWEYLNSTTIS